MFQTLAKLLMATTFVAHGLLGCCWHHRHWHVVSAEQAVVESDGCDGHRHDHAHRSAGEQATSSGDHGNRNPDAPHDPGCDEEHCVFVRTQDTVKSAMDVPLALVPFLVGAVFTDAQGVVESGSTGFGAFREVPPPSAPLHALRRVWLI
jgi:hypothetical protein